MNLNIYQLVKVLPVVLSHESKQRQESPAKGVKARVAIVGVPTSLHADVPFRTLAIRESNGAGVSRATIVISINVAVWFICLPFIFRTLQIIAHSETLTRRNLLRKPTENLGAGSQVHSHLEWQRGSNHTCVSDTIDILLLQNGEDQQLKMKSQETTKGLGTA